MLIYKTSPGRWWVPYYPEVHSYIPFTIKGLKLHFAVNILSMPFPCSPLPSLQAFDRIAQSHAYNSMDVWRRKQISECTQHIQNNIEPCIICGKELVSRASDIRRHMKRHDPNIKFVTWWTWDSSLAFSCGRDIWDTINLLIVIDENPMPLRKLSVRTLTKV